MSVQGIVVEVKPIQLWGKGHKLLGWFAGIHGPNKHGDRRTYWVPALGHALSGDPTPYPTPEQAMAAWEKGQPREIAHENDRDAQYNTKYPMPESIRQEINERQLWRYPVAP